MLATFDLVMGAYVSQHVGVLAGFRGGYGGLTEGCAGKCKNAFSYQVPVVVQYAFHDRLRGAYVEGGAGFLSTYGASTDSTSGDAPETLMLRSSIDYKLALGVRFASPDPGTKTAIDLKLTMDIGRFDSVEYHSVGGSVDGDIADAKKATHYAFGIGVGYHFAP